MTGRIISFLLVSLAVITVTGPANPASATLDWSAPQVSRTGQHWSRQLAKPLFADHLRVAPGASEQARFYVRNQCGAPAQVRVGVRVTDAPARLLASDVRLSVRTGAGRWQRVRHAGDTPVAWLVVGGGVTVPLAVRVGLPPRSGNSSMDQGLHVQVVVRLSEDQVTP